MLSVFVRYAQSTSTVFHTELQKQTHYEEYQLWMGVNHPQTLRQVVQKRSETGASEQMHAHKYSPSA